MIMPEDYYLKIKALIAINKYSASSLAKLYVNGLLKNANEAYDQEQRKLLAKDLASLADIARADAAVFLYSSAISLDKQEAFLADMLRCTYDDKEVLGTDNVIFVYQQSCNLTFRFPQTDSVRVLELKNKLYKWALVQYEKELQDYLVPLEKNECEKDLVIMIAQQVIAFQHGPTKSALDRCKTLMESGYRVLLINTAELLPNLCSISYIGAVGGSYCNEYLERNSLEWKGVNVPFFQCEHDMPNPDTIKQLLTVVRDMKPAFCISIATGTILEGLLSKMMPVLGIPMSQSELFASGANFQTYSGLKGREYYKWLDAIEFSEDRIIDTIFGFSILEQKEKCSREEIGLSEDDFVLVTAGGRLEQELDHSFWDVVRSIIKDIPNTKIMLLGGYEIKESESDIAGNIVSLGFVDDILSRVELCNLYINPHRKGGATSCVEAMFKGIPVLTDTYGDVASVAGEQFVVENYGAFPEFVKRYFEDKGFYNSQSENATKRAEIMLNADGEFMKLICEFKKRANL